jgi:hypothetical protein
VGTVIACAGSEWWIATLYAARTSALRRGGRKGTRGPATGFSLRDSLPSAPIARSSTSGEYDFEKYGKAAERKRLIDRWQKEVESLPK